jgi:hypothetical protein
MKQRNSYSCGLLYSVAPDDLSSLHLENDEGRAQLDWNAYASRNMINSVFALVFRLLKAIL